MNSRNKVYMRNERGQLGLMFVILSITIVLIFGALAIDFSHISTVRTQLHNATDAGALAGAQDLWFNLNQCEADARAVAALNSADGKPVVNDPSKGTTVNVIVTAPQGTTPGQVEVNASMRVSHWFAPFFEHWTDTVTVKSVAGTSGDMYRIASGQLFPLAVSVDAVPTDNKGNVLGLPMSQLHINDTVTFYIGSQSFKTAAFTSLSTGSASASTLNNMIDEILTGTPKKQVDIPSITVGDQINLNNGIDGQKSLTKEPRYSEILAEPAILVALIQGYPAYNQTTPVVGFAALKVTNVVANPMSGIVLSITGTLVPPPQVIGESGPFPTTGNPVNDSTISRFDLHPIQLIQ